MKIYSWSPGGIYEIKASGKYHKFVKMFKSDKNHIYSASNTRRKFQFDIFLTEDSKSGYQFFKNCFDGTKVICESSGSNSEIFKWLRNYVEQENFREKKVFVLADGAAFGSEIDRVLKLQSLTDDNFRICLPESFEWLILKSGLIKVSDLVSVLENPSEYIDSRDYFSWENFFEDFLIRNTLNTPFQYAKKEINPIYLNKNNSKKITEEIHLKSEE